MTTSILGWKLEPKSPLAYAEDDLWFFSEGEEKIFDTENDSFRSLSRKEKARQLLEDIDSLVKQEEKDTFSQWIEENVRLPILDEIGAVSLAEEPKNGTENVRHENKPDLTPPRTPEDAVTGTYVIFDYEPTDALHFSNENMVDFNYQPVRNYVEDGYVVLEENFGRQESAGMMEEEDGFRSDIDFPTAPPSPVPDLEKEMAVVDEVVRSTAQSLGNSIDFWDSEISNSQSSSPESSNSFEGATEDGSDDPEWVPVGKKTLAPTGKVPVQRSRPKPYARKCSQEDRWLRKKEQNKNAATRYRQKKKAEVSVILEEEKVLEEKKEKLKLRLSDIQMEIKYLKGLMRDLFKAKHLLIN